MPLVRPFAAFCGYLAVAGICVGQTISSSPAPMTPPASARPAIFQRSLQSAQAVGSANSVKSQISGVSYRLASSVEVDGMEKTLENYVAAFESLSLPQMRQVWPTLDRKHETAFKEVFASFRENSWRRRMDLACAIPNVVGDTANVECRETLTYGPPKGKTKEVGPVQIGIVLKGASGNWVVSDMKGSQ
jgi:hypothetical protein